MKGQADSMSGEDVILDSQVLSSHCVLHGGRRERALWACFYKDINVVHERSVPKA